MAHVLGEATEFWRLRVMRVDESDEPDLEWREDILYRRPPEDAQDEGIVYRVDAVSVGAEEHVVPLATFGSSQAAHDYVSGAQEDLETMTKVEFERAYLSGADSPAAQ